MTFSVDQIPVVRMEDKLGFQYIEKTVIYDVPYVYRD